MPGVWPRIRVKKWRFEDRHREGISDSHQAEGCWDAYKAGCSKTGGTKWLTAARRLNFSNQNRYQQSIQLRQLRDNRERDERRKSRLSYVSVQSFHLFPCPDKVITNSGRIS